MATGSPSTASPATRSSSSPARASTRRARARKALAGARKTRRRAATRCVTPKGCSTTLQHVSVEVEPENIAACVAFYEMLGFGRVDPAGTLAERATWVERAGTQTHLMPRDDAQNLPAGHLAVVVDAYDGTLAALRSAGFDPDPRQEHWGAP